MASGTSGVEATVTLQASQIDGAILFIGVALAFVIVLFVIEQIDYWLKKKKKRKWPPSKDM